MNKYIRRNYRKGSCCVLHLDEKNRGCTAVLDIQKAFAILQSGIIDREKIRIEDKQ